MPEADAPVRKLPTPRLEPEDWRIEQYQRLGFSWAASVELARAKDSTGYVWWKRVETALESGLSHEKCLSLFCNHLD